MWIQDLVDNFSVVVQTWDHWHIRVTEFMTRNHTEGGKSEGNGIIEGRARGSFRKPFSSYNHHSLCSLSCCLISLFQSAYVMFSKICPTLPYLTPMARTMFFCLNWKKKIIYWSIADLQCCANFYCTETWFSYASMHIIFQTLFRVVHHKVLNVAPCALQ